MYIRERTVRVKIPETDLLASHTSSLLFPSRRRAHHSALLRTQSSSRRSSLNPLIDMQNLKSSNLGMQSRGMPCRYTDLICEPRAAGIGNGVSWWSLHSEERGGTDSSIGKSCQRG